MGIRLTQLSTGLKVEAELGNFPCLYNLSFILTILLFFTAICDFLVFLILKQNGSFIKKSLFSFSINSVVIFLSPF